MRIVNLLGPQMTHLLTRRFGTAVEVVEVEPDSALEPEVHGEVIVTPGRGAGSPEVSWLLELARRGARWIHVAGANAGDLPAETFEDGRVVTCSRGAMAVPISEFALASMLAFEKRFGASWLSEPPPAGWSTQDGFDVEAESTEVSFEPPPRWGWSDLGTLDGRTLGIFGFGSIGRATAQKALAFGMTVVAVRRTSRPTEVEGVEVVTDVIEMAAAADHIVICAPATPATRHTFGERVFATTKPTAHLVNVARGALVDQDALLRALDAGRFAFASLDVTEPEPLPAGHPLYSHPRVHLTPHISWCSPIRQRRTAEIVVGNVEAWAAGRPLHGVVDPADRY